MRLLFKLLGFLLGGLFLFSLVPALDSALIARYAFDAAARLPSLFRSCLPLAESQKCCRTSRTDAAPCQMKPSTFWSKPTPISDRCYADLLARFAQLVRFRDKISAMVPAPTLEHSGFSVIGRRFGIKHGLVERRGATKSAHQTRDCE